MGVYAGERPFVDGAGHEPADFYWRGCGYLRIYAQRRRQFATGLLLCNMAAAVLPAGKYTLRLIPRAASFSGIANAYLTSGHLGRICLFVLLYQSPAQRLLRYLAASGAYDLRAFIWGNR